MIPKQPCEMAWGDGQRQGRYCLTRIVVWAVEWAALLFGLLPCGGRGGRWPRHKAVLALAAAGLAFALNFAFIAAYFKRFLHWNFARMWTSVLYFSSVSLYMVWTLGSFAILPAMWLKCPHLTQLLDALTQHSLLSAVTGRRYLQSVMWFSYVLLDLFVCLWMRFAWDALILQMSTESVVFLFCVWYSHFSLPLIHIFPLALLVGVGHTLHAALADTNEELKQELPLEAAKLSGSHSLPRQQVLRYLRARYIHLRRLHTLLADALAVPLIFWTLHRILTITVFIFYMIAYSDAATDFYTQWLCGVGEFSLSLVLLGFLADGITEQAAAPRGIIYDRDVATESEKIQPEVETQVLRLLEVCDRPLVIRPCGLYTVSRSNLLAVMMGVTTHMVVLLQFNIDDPTFLTTTAAPTPSPANTTHPPLDAHSHT